jgi:alpha-amylase
MAPYRVLDIGTDTSYFDCPINSEVLKKVAQKCYLPTNKLMLELIKKNPGKFKIAYSISGVVLEQFEEQAPEVLQSFKALAATGQVEFIAETYYHSLAAIFNADEFRSQVKLHMAVLKRYFNVVPTTFRNTELIYSNDIARLVEDMGFKAMLTEGADHILDWRSPNFVYEPVGSRGMKLLLKNYKLSVSRTKVGQSGP